MTFQHPLLVALAVTVKQRRSELMLTEEDLADIMGVPVEFIMDIEASHARMSSKNTLMLLALALKLPEKALFEYLVTEQNDDSTPVGRKPVVLPPMFPRRTSIERVLPKTAPVEEQDQQKLHLGLQAVDAVDRPAAKAKVRPPLATKSSSSSPFIPRQAVQTQSGNLWKNKGNSDQQVRHEMPDPDCFGTVEKINNPVEPVNVDDCKDPEKPEQLFAGAKRSQYVPLLASKLPFGDLQRETGIFRIEDAPDPVPCRKVVDS